MYNHNHKKEKQILQWHPLYIIDVKIPKVSDLTKKLMRVLNFKPWRVESSKTITRKIRKSPQPLREQLVWKILNFPALAYLQNFSQGSRWIGGDQHWATGPIIQLLMFVRWREMDGTGCWVEAQLGGGPPGHGLGRLLGIHVTVESEVVW